MACYVSVKEVFKSAGMPSPTMIGQLKVATFNLLAPIYKRTPMVSKPKARESDNEEAYMARQLQLMQLILDIDADVVCLQEFWFHEQLMKVYEHTLGQKYDFYYMRRTGKKGDGLATLVSRERVLCVDKEERSLCRVGDRVALLLRLALVRGQGEETMLQGNTFLVLNTHLT